jgi:hypothetical protein
VGGQILISEQTYQRVQDVVRVRGTLTVELKGLDRPLTLYDVAGVGGDYRVSVQDAGDDALRSLEAPLAVACYRLEGKSVSPVPIAARLVALGANNAELLLETPVAERSNVKLLVTPAASGPVYEVYGKIVELHDGRARLAFTSVSDEARAYLAARTSDVNSEPGRTA